MSRAERRREFMQKKSSSDSSSVGGGASSSDKRKQPKQPRKQFSEEIVDLVKFSPGRFPLVFESGPGAAKVDVLFAIDEQNVVMIADKIFTSISAAPQWNEFLSKLQFETPERFKHLFKSSAVLCAGQSILKAHQNEGKPIGDFSCLTGNITHLRSVRMATNQFGECHADEVGSKFSLVSYETELKTNIRTAVKLFPADESSRPDEDKIKKTTWLPSEKGDLRTSYIIACQLSRWIRENRADICITTDSLFQHIKANTLHPLIEDIVQLIRGQALRGSMNFLFTLVGAKARQWVETMSTAPNQISINNLGLYWPNPSLEDLSWNLNYKAECNRIITKMSSCLVVFNESFHCEDSSSLGTDHFGSLDQFSTCSVISDSVTLLQGLIATDCASESLAMAFECYAWCCPIALGFEIRRFCQSHKLSMSGFLMT